MDLLPQRRLSDFFCHKQDTIRVLFAAVGEDLKYSGANTPLHVRRSRPDQGEFKNRRKSLSCRR